MDTYWGLGPTAWTAIYTLLTAGLLFVAVITAIYAALQWRNARGQGEEQRRAQAEELRPYVTVTLEPSRASMHIFELVIRNIGRRPAEAIDITFTPPPVRAREHGGGPAMSDMKMLTEPMSLLAPGQEIRVLYDNHLERKDRVDLPIEHRVDVSYRDTSENSYQGCFTLDIEALKGASWVVVGSTHTISKTLDKIEKTLARSSVLQKRGSLHVDATTETRAESTERRAREELADAEGYVDLLQRSGREANELRFAEKNAEKCRASLQRLQGVAPTSWAGRTFRATRAAVVRRLDRIRRGRHSDTSG